MNIYMWQDVCGVSGKPLYFVTCDWREGGQIEDVCKSPEEAALFFVQQGCELDVKWNYQIGYYVRAVFEGNFVTLDEGFASSWEAQHWIELIMADNRLSGYESMDTEGQYVYF